MIPSPNEPYDDPLLCHRCTTILQAGRGDFYVVWIEALADPTPPSISDADLACDPGEEIDDLLEQMRSMSERELMDQVHRRVTIHLCRSCYEQWIENPTSQ